MKMNALLYIPGIFTSTDPHKYAYISKRINPIIIISSDLDSTINFALERHVFGKSQFSPFFFVLKGLCPLKEVTKNNPKLEEKFDEVMKEYKSYAEIVGQSHINTTAQPQTTEIPDQRKIMRDDQIAQLAEETGIKLRACNFLMHGVAENVSGGKHQAKERDGKYVSDFLQTLGVNKEYKAIYRLGKIDVTKEQSARPITVVMHSDEGNDIVMANLKELKGKEQYKGVSITDDNTIKESNTLREWVKKAKKASEEEPTDSQYEWKARGTPKNRMCLMKFKKPV